MSDNKCKDCKGTGFVASGSGSVKGHTFEFQDYCKCEKGKSNKDNQVRFP